ncbi:septum site-determining protein MinC [Thiomicrospira sp. R3]|uniref:septum site-determining protein MinC n=1 Tax=Thiomicrospira sp. R3 TaxID=3035472 RepID=UPI00259B0FDE|nr:septum site-determining protein MinC [Thiomicrospira sp. R3]WFE68289.1 septum site-determining protein MinC [Thiomicrospira sp. R3]
MNQVIALKGSVLSLSVLKVFSDDFTEVKQVLAQKVAQAPDFFKALPIVIEPEIAPLAPTFLAQLVELLHQNNMMPVGVRTADATLIEQAEYAGLAVFEPVKASSEKATQETKPVKSVKEMDDKPDQGALLIDSAVRSGQQVYAKGRDLIVKSSINPGAEVVSDGHIHVYGKAKGKLFAGSSGNRQARIFVQQLDAEMVCIAGLYQMAEDIKPEYKQGWVEICLQQDRLVFNLL